MFLLTTFIVSAFAQNPQITTDSGIIEGLTDGMAKQYWSIPYANPPIGDMRWKESEYVAPWSGIKKTQTQPPGCPQNCTEQNTPHICPEIISEDCLYLNVFTPMNASSNNPILPVMLFIHGGNFKLGYSGGILYNGTRMANHTNTIIVTINYRVGILGFLWSREIGMNGNYGMLDQKLAIKWMKNNAKSFGGNPDLITIYGQSAGAMSVALHLMEQSTDDKLLYNYAIMESEPFGLPLRDTITWGDIANNFFNLIDCKYNIIENKDQDKLWNCIRNVSFNKIIETQVYMETEVLIEFDHFLQLFMPWTPTIGTDVYIEQPIFAFQKGNYRDIPFIVGTTSQESIPFIYGAYPNPITYENVATNLAIMIGVGNAEKVLVHYPPPLGLDDYRPYYTVIATDGIFACGVRNITAEHEQSYNNMNSNAYLYHFDHASTFNQAMWGNYMQYCWGDHVCHGEELPYVFYPNGSPIGVYWIQGETQLSFRMMNYWTQFAKNGNPGNGWFPFILGSETSMKFQCNNFTDLSDMESNYDIDNNKCKFWDTLGYDWIK